jgi:hypothetical protein
LWDEWLNAYSYDAPSEEMKELYLWMEEEAACAEADEIARFVQTALDAGANCVLLPKDAQEKSVSRAGRTLHMNVVSLGEYYAMYIGNAD